MKDYFSIEMISSVTGAAFNFERSTNYRVLWHVQPFINTSVYSFNEKYQFSFWDIC